MKILFCTSLISACLISINANALSDKTFKKFSQHDNSSEFIIKYDDVDLILDMSVLYVGHSIRAKAKKDESTIGTRFRNKSKPLTALEGNRFFYEEYKTPAKIKLIENVRKSLEYLPTVSPLELFTKNEQLGYWLNLYNISLLEQLIHLYPKRSLKPDLEESDLFSKKRLSVDGEQLSLDDIKQIVIYNAGHDPLLIYGFHQGNIAGPDIRKFAYTGSNVWETLTENAKFFINSNRGTYSKSATKFRVSYIYEKNKVFFEDFDNDLKSHLSKYLLRSYKEKLHSATQVSANIVDWSYADLYGSTRSFGGGSATNSAALLDAFTSTPGSGNSFMPSGDFNGQISDMSPLNRFSPKHRSHLLEVLKIREIREGHVTVQDLENVDNKSN